MNNSKKKSSTKEEKKEEEFFTDKMHQNIFLFQESEFRTERKTRKYLKPGANISSSKPSYHFS